MFESIDSTRNSPLEVLSTREQRFAWLARIAEQQGGNDLPARGKFSDQEFAEKVLLGRTSETLHELQDQLKALIFETGPVSPKDVGIGELLSGICAISLGCRGYSTPSDIAPPETARVEEIFRLLDILEPQLALFEDKSGLRSLTRDFRTLLCGGDLTSLSPELQAVPLVYAWISDLGKASPEALARGFSSALKQRPEAACIALAQLVAGLDPALSSAESVFRVLPPGMLRPDAGDFAADTHWCRIAKNMQHALAALQERDEATLILWDEQHNKGRIATFIEQMPHFTTPSSASCLDKAQRSTFFARQLLQQAVRGDASLAATVEPILVEIAALFSSLNEFQRELHSRLGSDSLELAGSFNFDREPHLDMLSGCLNLVRDVRFTLSGLFVGTSNEKYAVRADAALNDAASFIIEAQKYV